MKPFVRKIKEVGRPAFPMGNLPLEEFAERSPYGYYIAKPGSYYDSLARGDEIRWRRKGYMPLKPFEFRADYGAWKKIHACIYGLVIYQGKRKAAEGYFKMPGNWPPDPWPIP